MLEELTESDRELFFTNLENLNIDKDNIFLLKINFTFLLFKFLTLY